jgi:hypothetical protein
MAYKVWNRRKICDYAVCDTVFCFVHALVQRNFQCIPLALGPTCSHIQSFSGAISPRVKWAESEANQSPLPSPEPRMDGAILHLRFYVFMACTWTLLFITFLTSVQVKLVHSCKNVGLIGEELNDKFSELLIWNLHWIQLVGDRFSGSCPRLSKAKAGNFISWSTASF